MMLNMARPKLIPGNRKKPKLDTVVSRSATKDQVTSRKSYLPMFMVLAMVLAPVFTQYSTTSRILKYCIILSIVLLSYLLVYSNPYNIRESIQRIAPLAVPIIMIAIIALVLTNAARADIIAKEDGPAEYLSAVFLFVGSFVMLLSSFSYFIRKQYSLTVLFLIGAGLFFVIGMEEISWMQRIVGRESSEFFLVHNMQGETNLHNFNNALSEKLYYTGGFILLTLMPYYRQKISGLLNKLNLGIFEPLLPAAWLLLPFLATVGFAHGRAFGPSIGTLSLTSFIMVVVSIFICLDLLNKNRQNVLVFSSLLLSLIIIVTAFATYNFIDYESLGLRVWFYSEYREMFIALGITLYSLDRFWALKPKAEPIELKV